MRYYRENIRNLLREATNRFERLSSAMIPDPRSEGKEISINGYAVRLAVEDFKVILAEIKKLK